MKKALTLASIAAMSLTLAACGSNDAAPADTTAAADANMTAGDTMAADADMAAPAAAPAMTGQEFANAAGASDAFEIASSKLAQSKGSAKAVKDFAAEMIKAHTDSTAKIKKAAAAASPAITPDPTMNAEQQSMLDGLGKLSGADLDKQYATDQVAAHEKTLAAMQGYAASGDVPSLKTAAGEIAPIVAHHLEMAKALPK